MAINWNAILTIRNISAAAGAVAATLSAIGYIYAGEPHWPATRSYVRDTVTQSTAKLKTRQIQVELQVLEGRAENVKSKINDRQLLLQKQEGPPEYKQLIIQQIEEFKDTLGEINNNISGLRGELKRAQEADQ